MRKSMCQLRWVLQILGAWMLVLIGSSCVSNKAAAPTRSPEADLQVSLTRAEYPRVVIGYRLTNNTAEPLTVSDFDLRFLLPATIRFKDPDGEEWRLVHAEVGGSLRIHDRSVWARVVDVPARSTVDFEAQLPIDYMFVDSHDHEMGRHEGDAPAPRELRWSVDGQVRNTSDPEVESPQVFKFRTDGSAILGRNH